MEIVSRENEILQTLALLVQKRLDFVVVGGYAVSGLGKHRFSVDCDLVLSNTNLEETKTTLGSFGYLLDLEKEGFDETYAGKFVRYKKALGKLPVTFDLLVDSLVCRATGASWSFEYIKNHSVESRIGGIETTVKSRVPEKELNIAFKIHSGRRTDVRDIIVLMEEADTDKILAHLKRGNLEALKEQMNNIKNMLVDSRLVDSLTGVFSLNATVDKEISYCQKVLKYLSEDLEPIRLKDSN
jgi:hypothetical protein